MRMAFSELIFSTATKSDRGLLHTPEEAYPPPTDPAANMSVLLKPMSPVIRLLNGNPLLTAIQLLPESEDIYTPVKVPAKSRLPLAFNVHTSRLSARPLLTGVQLAPLFTVAKTPLSVATNTWVPLEAKVWT